jgi:uncharacterized protein (DUF2461 family)
MRNDPFYLSKDKSLEASLGVLLVDGNFEDSIAYFCFFVKLIKCYIGQIPWGQNEQELEAVRRIIS